MDFMKSDVLNYTVAIKALCGDICRRLPEFQHIDVDRVGFGISKARKPDNSKRSIRYAFVTPMRFKDGAVVELRKTTNIFGEPETRYFTTEQVLGEDNRPLLYLMTIALPTFYNLGAKEKLNTIMHELYHISPKFDGDVRRFPGRNWQHGSAKEYDARAAALAQKWLKMEPDPEFYNFLALDHEGLCKRFKRIVAMKYPKIKIVPISREFALKLDPSLGDK